MAAAGEVVGEALDGLRLDRAVALVADVSRSAAARLVSQGGVRLDGTVVTSGSHRITAGDSLWIDAVDDPDPVPAPDGNVTFTTVFEDADVIVVDKPAGLVVHPGAGHDRGTLVNGLLARYPELSDVGDRHRPGIVHRLDRGTSGLLVVARSERAHQALVEQMRSHEPLRLYDTLVWGHPEASSGLVDAPVGRSSRNPLRMAVTERGRPARTRYEVQHRFNRPATLALLTCRLETGRTHQIRVHLRAIGHPVVGDPTYGASRAADGSGAGPELSRPFLHARRLSFRHPASGRPVTAESPLPADLAQVLQACL